MMAENIATAMMSLQTLMFKDDSLKEVVADPRLVLFGASKLSELVESGKQKLTKLMILMEDLRDECDIHNFYLSRLQREVKRKITKKNASRRVARKERWRKAKKVVDVTRMFELK